jgi:hypothetical protein
MERLYADFEGKTVEKQDLKKLLKNDNYLKKIICEAFYDKYFRKTADDLPPLEGNDLLVSQIIFKFVANVLKIDMEIAPFRYTASEYPCRTSIKTACGNVNIKGFIDRIDEKDATVRIIDYKTGKNDYVKFDAISELFDMNRKKRTKYALQAILYCLLYRSDAMEKNISSGIYFVKNLIREKNIAVDEKTEGKSNASVHIFEDFWGVEDAFLSRLRDCLERIFSPDEPFFQTQIAEKCKYCPHKGICNR